MTFIQLYQVNGEKPEEMNFEEIGKALNEITELAATQEATQKENEAYKRSGEDDDTSSTLPINTKVVYKEVGDYVSPERRRYL